MIPFYSFQSIHQDIEPQLVAAASDIITSGNYVFGTERFEEEFADYVGSRYCVACNNGTSALHLALMSLGIGPGDEVITVSHTFRATAAAILYCGAKPVYVDIDADTFVMDPYALERAITPRTRAIIPVHLYGNMCNMHSIMMTAREHNIAIVEDSSQAHGSTLSGRHAGTMGDLGTFSFYPGKGLGALGDAGCVVTNDENLARFMRSVRTWDDNHVGYNYRMANVQAEWLRIKLRTFDQVLAAKRDIAAVYDQHWRYAQTREDVQHSYHVYPILVEDRPRFMQYAQEQGLQVKSHYPIPVHRMPAYRAPYSLPITDYVSQHQVSLPIYPGVDYQRVIDIVNDYPGALL
jgi:dTDP-4-amino-4,6-dideoxygalactose transaminase